MEKNESNCTIVFEMHRISKKKKGNLKKKKYIFQTKTRQTNWNGSNDTCSRFQYDKHNEKLIQLFKNMFEMEMMNSGIVRNIFRFDSNSGTRLF